MDTSLPARFPITSNDANKTLKQIHTVTNSFSGINPVYIGKITETIHKRIQVAPSLFLNGCVCGHHVNFRDVIHDPRKRKNTRRPGITIRPKTPPISIGLRKYNK